VLDRIVETGINTIKVIPVGKTLPDSVTLIRIWREALDGVLEKKSLDIPAIESEIAACSPFPVDFRIRER
jgi:collagenase-like PrtC family protease